MFPTLLAMIFGVPLTIWWPRPASPEHPAQARAYRRVRLASALLLVGSALYIIVSLSDALYLIGWQVACTIALSYMAFMLAPLATCAGALDTQRREPALIGSFIAALFAGGQAWLSLLSFLVYSIGMPGTPLWWRLGFLCSAAFAAGGLAIVLEFYALIRRPPQT